MQAWLRVAHQRANIQQVRLLPVTVVGRSPECHLRIASAQVSRRHCQVSLRPDGVYVEDLGSANGTYLDDARIPPRTPTFVRPGGKLDVGPAKFIVEYKELDGSAIIPMPGPTVEAAEADSSSAEVEETLDDLSLSDDPDEDSESVDQETLQFVEVESDVVGADEDTLGFPPIVEDPKASPPPQKSRTSFFGLFRRSSNSGPNATDSAPDAAACEATAEQAAVEPRR